MSQPDEQAEPGRTSQRHLDVEAGDRANTSATSDTAFSSGPASDVEKAGPSPSEDTDALINWDGPDDPENPMNWPKRKRYMQIIMIALYTLITNLAATMFAPGAAQLAEEFGVTSTIILSMTVSIYVLGFAIGPLILAPLSEMHGRLPVYTASGIVYIAFIFGSAFATSIESFIVFRFLSGSAGSAPMTLAGGTLADVIAPQERAKWMALFVLGPMLGPIIGPIAGGFIIQSVGWRWVFRVLLITIGLLVILSVFQLRETYGPVILRRRALRRSKGSSNAARQVLPPKDKSATQSLVHSITRPLRLLLFSPIVLFLSLYAAFAFGLMFLLFTTFAEVFSSQYQFSIGITGLTYLGLGLGMSMGVAAQALLGQKIVDSRTAKRGSKEPEDRLAFMACMAPILPVGLFWYGWSAEYHTHWIVPILGTLPVGFGIVCIMMPQMIYLVEIFGAQAGASALAANTVLRSVAGAFLPLAGPTMYNKLGFGWGNSLLGFLAVAFIPVPWILFLYGARIRKSRNINI